MRRFEVFVGILAIAGVVAAGQARAGGKSEASERFEKGVALYKAGNYEGALVEFKAAYEAEPHYKVKYNVGMTLYQLHRYVEAEGELTAYLSGGGDEVPAEKKQEVQAVLSEIMGYVGTLIVDCEVAGASLYLDGEFAASLPMTVPLRLDVGEYAVEVRADGYSTFHQKVTLPGGKQVDVEAKLEKIAGAGGAVTEKVVEKVVEKTLPSGRCEEDRDCTVWQDVCYAGRCMSKAHKKGLIRKGTPRIVSGGILLGLMGIAPIGVGLGFIIATAKYSGVPGLPRNASFTSGGLFMLIGAPFVVGGGVLVHQGLVLRREADSLKGMDEEGGASAGLGTGPWRLAPFIGPPGGGPGMVAGITATF